MHHLFFSLFLFYSVSLNAWEAHPDYISIDESEPNEFDNPSLTDSEYQSDLFVFSQSLKDEYKILSSDKYLRISMGSLGSKNFFIGDTLKIHQDLSQKLQVRILYFREQDFDKNYDFDVMQLKFLIFPKLSFGLYGTSYFQKSRLDIGGVLYFQPDENTEVKIYHTAPDFSRNERNKNSDQFIQQPKVFGFRAIFLGSLGSGEFVDSSSRWETPIQWEFPTQQLNYFFERQSHQIKIRQKFMNHYLGLKLFWERKWEKKVPTNTGNSSHVSAVKTYGNFELERIGVLGHSDQAIRAGFQVADRKYLGSAGEVRQSHYLPYLWWSFEIESQKNRKNIFSVGLDTTLFRESGSDSWVGRTIQSSHYEHRLSTSYEFNFENQASLELFFTFDLDRIGTGETWEGGAGSFKLQF